MSSRAKTDEDSWRGSLRELISQSMPARPLASDNELREHQRFIRVMPVMVTPFRHKTPVLSETKCFLSHDVSDEGISLVHQQAWTIDVSVIGLWHVNHRDLPLNGDDRPIFFLGHAKSSRSIGGGFWQTGIQMKTIYLDPDYVSDLETLAMQRLATDAHRQRDELRRRRQLDPMAW